MLKTHTSHAAAANGRVLMLHTVCTTKSVPNELPCPHQSVCSLYTRSTALTTASAIAHNSACGSVVVLVWGGAERWVTKCHCHSQGQLLTLQRQVHPVTKQRTPGALFQGAGCRFCDQEPLGLLLGAAAPAKTPSRLDFSFLVIKCAEKVRQLQKRPSY